MESRRQHVTDPADAPILVLGSGQRCGSTLVQRLLTSHPDVMIWGEHGGHLRDLLTMNTVLEAWDANVSAHGRDAFKAGGVQSWMANVLPGPGALHDAARAYLLTLFHGPARAQGRPRWGFKEVRFGYAEADALRDLFAGLCVVHVTRDPRDVLVSLDGWERAEGWWRRDFTRIAVRAWVEVNDSFLQAGPRDWVMSRRYEDLVADPEAFIEAVAAFIGARPDALDPSVFDRRIRGYGDDSTTPQRRWHDLTPDLRALLDDPALRRVAAAYGYAL